MDAGTKQLADILNGNRIRRSTYTHPAKCLSAGLEQNYRMIPLIKLRLNARKDSGHCRWRVNVHRLSSTGRAESEDAAWRHHPLMLSMTEAELPERNAQQDIHRQAVERLALMGRAVSVSPSLSGLRSSQSQTHGCCQ